MKNPNTPKPEITTQTIMGQGSFVYKSGAEKAGRRKMGDRFVGTHRLPSGNYCYTFKASWTINSEVPVLFPY